MKNEICRKIGLAEARFYDVARPLRALGDPTPHECGGKVWASEPAQIILDPIH